MNEDLKNIQIKPIRNYEFTHWFQEVRYNGETLSDEERKDFASMIDETIEENSAGFPIMQDVLNHFNNPNDELHNDLRTIVSAMLFVLTTRTDIMAATKFFIIANKDYDRRFMRGKLRVILNEGFKRLYGFQENKRKDTEWYKLKPILNHFPEEIRRQYQELTQLINNQSKESTWWKEERDLETHLQDSLKLYHSRQEEIIESKVAIESMKLYCTLMAVSEYLENLYTCIFNYIAGMYQEGELKENNISL